MAILLKRSSQCHQVYHNGKIMQRVLMVVLCISKCSCSNMQDFAVSVDDILSDSLMPTALLLDQSPHHAQTDNSVPVNKSEDGSWKNAFSTMRFHRDKMNEYKCSNFLTENLLSEMFPSSHILTNRIGVLEGNDSLNIRKINSKGNMLYDEGSSGYSNWLEKSSTLEDIYDNYMKRSVNPSSKKRIDRTFDKDQSEYDEWSEYEEGDITGYAVHNPPLSEIQDSDGMHYNMHHHTQFSRPESDTMSYSSPYGNHEQYYDTEMHPPQATAGNLPLSFSTPFFTLGKPSFSVEDFGKNFHLNSDFLNTNEILTASGYYHDHDDYPMQESKFGKALGLKDLFEIALTTLAFLSFGMFILHVIMCITMGNTTNNMMMMPMDMGPETEEIRGKREASYSMVMKMNDLARITLMSIDAAQVADTDKGICLQLAICENNKLSRTFTDSTKYWIPLWSLGMTWYSSRIIKGQSAMMSIIDSLKAALLGLGGADCAKIFAKCDHSHQKKQKILTRRKRLAENYKFNWNI